MAVNRTVLIGLSVLSLTATISIALAQNTSNPMLSGNTTPRSAAPHRAVSNFQCQKVSKGASKQENNCYDASDDLTLEYYNRRTRNHDVSQNTAAMLQYIEGERPFFPTA